MTNHTPHYPVGSFDQETLLGAIDAVAIGERVRAYRIGASLLAEEVAEKLGISRAAVYRLESGDIVKIDTLIRVAQLLNLSLASLIGVEVEYYDTVGAMMERLRQIELRSSHIVSHFESASLLLMSDQYLGHLKSMLHETLAGTPDGTLAANAATVTQQPGNHQHKRIQIEQVLAILRERKLGFAERKPDMVCLIGLRDVARFLQTGLIGMLDLPQNIREKRIAAARAEIEHIAMLMEDPPGHVQIGLIDETMPASTFELCSDAHGKVLAVSPFRFGELPNICNGIGTVTRAPQAIRMYQTMIARLWKTAHRGQSGARRLRQLLPTITAFSTIDGA